MYGWGRYPCIEADVNVPLSKTSCTQSIMNTPTLITRGLGRSYGDSSLAAHMLDTHQLDHFIDFEETTGLLTCEAGLSLRTILSVFVSQGWFLPVTPGTQLVTVGGAIASDVHGKNHHLEGTFTEQVISMELLLGNGERVSISRTEKPDLFHATCGGMGLTGVILSASICLKRIPSSDMIEKTIRAPDLDTLLTAFSDHATSTYSVAWVDCLARGKHLGRSLLMLGEHAQEGPMVAHGFTNRSVPFNMPSVLLNHTTIKLFNTLHYAAASLNNPTRRVSFESFFYPLDSIGNWNRLYGKRGFIQYQFVLPFSAGVRGLREILDYIAASGRGSFLAVLKVFGKRNKNVLSFPLEGYSLALDFKVEPAVFLLLNELDRLVLGYGGRIYLAKDARMSKETFMEGYPQWQEFEAIRAKYHAIGKFASLQSRRLGLK